MLGGDLLVGDIDGETGNDWLFGDIGNDTLIGGSGDDVLNGDDGSVDQLWGGSGSDQLVGGNLPTFPTLLPNSDILVGGAVPDYLVGDSLMARGITLSVARAQTSSPHREATGSSMGKA